MTWLWLAWLAVLVGMVAAEQRWPGLFGPRRLVALLFRTRLGALVVVGVWVFLGVHFFARWTPFPHADLSCSLTRRAPPSSPTGSCAYPLPRRDSHRSAAIASDTVAG